MVGFLKTCISIGGYRSSLDSVDEYKLGASQTSHINTLNHPRYDHGCTTYKRKGDVTVVVVAGGSGGAGSPSSTSVEEMTSDGTSWSRWTIIGQLPISRSSFSMLATGRLLFVVGGAGVERSVMTSEDGRRWEYVIRYQPSLGGTGNQVLAKPRKAGTAVNVPAKLCGNGKQ